ncbi:DNA polymerase III subunit alpha [Brevibacillus ginsengisoli]|uniref:DNA polymerase III subunit alpha n=1 Tax=Brevibacillus ginsengisoli TaxID=363854 RepID=UPI003CE91369
MSTPFVHLHVHTEYSLLDGTARINELIPRAVELGMKALAITDHNNLYGAIPFYRACKEAGIRPIIGLEVNLVDGSLDERITRKSAPPFHLVLLAENHTGYRNLLKLTTIAQTEGGQILPRINRTILAKHTAGLIAIADARESEIARLLLAGDITAAAQTAQWYQKLFGPEHFYLELQDHGLEIERRLNQRVVKMHQELGIPLVVTNNVHYVNQEDHELHDVLLAIKEAKTLDEPERFRYETDQYYLKSGEEMARNFAFAPKALENTLRIAERCQLELVFDQHILPKFPLPDDIDPNEYLRKLCLQGCRERYGELTPKITAQLDHELTIITGTGFTDYFLIVWDFMRYAHDHGIPTGPGRGSAAGSIVSYALHITNVDPLAFNLLFERFLNPERITMPDIDIDFAVERRDEVIRYVADKYGHDRVAQIITFGTLAARAAVRDVGRVQGLSLGLVDRVAKMIPQSHSMNIDRAMQMNPDLVKLTQDNPQVAKLIQAAKGLEGLPRHASTHAAGVVISRDPLTEYVPLQLGSEGLSLTQYPMEVLEQVGLLKMDFLGLRNLTIIQETLNHLRSIGIELSLNQIPMNDEASFRMLSRGETTGVFQLESSGMRNVLRELKPSTIDDIIAVLALYRPGPMEIIPQYIQAKHGKEKVHYAHPDLEPILCETHGFMIYQEQIMQISSKMAGFSLGESDILRRAVGKKKRELLAEQRERFVEGSIRQGYDEKLANEIYDLIVRFADYGYNKAHSVAYAMISYQMAYLKANYPVAFMAALLSLSIGSQGKIAEYVDEARRLQVEVLPPDVNHSEALFTVQNNKIRFGLAAVKNVGYGAVESIVRERQKAAYRDIVDFCSRVDSRLVNRRVIESLILCGALDSLPGSRAQLLVILDEALEKGLLRRRERDEAQLNLFAPLQADSNTDSTTDQTVIPVSSYPEVPDFTGIQRLKEERDMLGVYVSGHPLDDYRHLSNHPGVIRIARIEENQRNQTVKLVGMVLESKQIQTKKGEPMAFLVVEDRTAPIEVVVFPQVFQKHQSLLQKEQLIVVEGRVDVQEDICKLIASRFWDVTTLPLPQAPSQSQIEAQSQIEVQQQPETHSQSKVQTETVAFVKISAKQERDSTLTRLKKLLVERRGTISVLLYYEGKKQTIRLPAEYCVDPDESFLEQAREIVGRESVILKEMPINWGG